MKMDYYLLRNINEDLQEDDCRVIKQYLINGRLMKEIAEDENRTYEAIKKKSSVFDQRFTRKSLIAWK